MLKYFKSSFILFGLGLIAAFFIGGIQATTIVAILCILEISLSFDNAVVNAKKLNKYASYLEKKIPNMGYVNRSIWDENYFPNY